MNLIKSNIDFPRLPEESHGFPQIRSIKGKEMLQLFNGTNVLNDQNCCQNIPVKDIVRVVEIPPFVNIFHRFPGLKLTLKCIEKFRTRNGMKNVS